MARVGVRAGSEGTVQPEVGVRVEVRHQLGRSMAKAPARARLEYHRSHLLYYRKHNDALSRVALAALLAARGALSWASAALAGDTRRGEEARALLGLVLERP